MGETTELILEGLLCQSCGSFIVGEMSGYPRDCEDCEGDE